MFVARGRDDNDDPIDPIGVKSKSGSVRFVKDPFHFTIATKDKSFI